MLVRIITLHSSHDILTPSKEVKQKMAQFLGVHKMANIGAGTDQDAVDGFNKYKDAASKMGLNATHAHYSLEKGFAYCITEAESADEVKKAHASVDIQLEDVIEVKTVS